MTTADFVECLAKTESGDVSDVVINGHHYTKEGDNGRARGRWQLHPDWIHTQEVRFGLQPLLNETHDDFERRLVTAFVDFHNGQMPDEEIVMYFHEGHHMVPSDPKWDAGYLERFQTFAAEFAHP